jgi:hypothetical protein
VENLGREMRMGKRCRHEEERGSDQEVGFGMAMRGIKYSSDLDVSTSNTLRAISTRRGPEKKKEKPKRDPLCELTTWQSMGDHRRVFATIS